MSKKDHLLSYTSERLQDLEPYAGLAQKSHMDLAAHRESLVALCRDNSFQKILSAAILERTRAETRALLSRQEIVCDCLVIGTGPAGVTLTTALRASHPAARLLMADERSYRGGLFAAPGFNYQLNTPRSGPIGFAGEMPYPNHLGPATLLQINEITPKDAQYSTRQALAMCLQLNGFVAAPALVDSKALHVTIPVDTSERYTTAFLDKMTGQNFSVHSPFVVLARGRGKPTFGLDMTQPDTRETFAQCSDKIFVSEAFNSYVEGLSPQDLFALLQKGLVFIGGGDSSSTALGAILFKLLTAYSTDEVKSLHIDVYGAKYKSGSDFEEVVRIPRYNVLIPYIGTLIHPHPEKVESLMTVGTDQVGIKTANTVRLYGTVAILTGYKNPPIEDMIKAADSRDINLVDLNGGVEFDGELIARQVEGENIFQIGVDVPETFPGQAPVFSKSIVRLTPRILAVAQQIADAFERNGS